MCGSLMCAPSLGTWPATQACALDQESNQQPLGLQAGTQSTEPHQPGLESLNYQINVKIDVNM